MLSLIMLLPMNTLLMYLFVVFLRTVDMHSYCFYFCVTLFALLALNELRALTLPSHYILLATLIGCFWQFHHYREASSIPCVVLNREASRTVLPLVGCLLSSWQRRNYSQQLDKVISFARQHVGSCYVDGWLI
jgi:hypothetical protein